jgi:hypothetical protein
LAISFIYGSSAAIDGKDIGAALAAAGPAARREKCSRREDRTGISKKIAAVDTAFFFAQEVNYRVTGSRKSGYSGGEN